MSIVGSFSVNLGPVFAQKTCPNGVKVVEFVVFRTFAFLRPLGSIFDQSSPRKKTETRFLEIFKNVFSHFSVFCKKLSFWEAFLESFSVPFGSSFCIIFERSF